MLLGIVLEPSHIVSPEDRGLLFGCVLNGIGGATPLDWPQVCDWKPTHENDVLWVHLDRTVPGMDAWLSSKFGVSDPSAEILVSNETSPRAFSEGNALVAVLRGINFNEGADPDDMIALQLWADQNYVVSLRRRHMQSPRQVLADLEQGFGPKSSGELVAELAEKLVLNMSHQIVSMNDRIDVLEEGDEDLTPDMIMDEIAAIRRTCLAMKRFMSPQFEALQQIQKAAPEWMSEADKRSLRETNERLRRYLDAIDVSKESVIVLQDDLNNRAAQLTNNTMYMLSIVAAVFLPLSFVTGLLGMNVGGMPGVSSTFGFGITIVLLVLIFAVQLYVFRRLKWL